MPHYALTHGPHHTNSRVPYRLCRDDAILGGVVFLVRRHMKSNLGSVFLILAALLLAPLGCTTSGDERIVVLTFDGSFKSHRTLVAPLLKELGLGATFFVTHPSNNPSDSLTWSEIAEIDQMGFEIGNRGWSCLLEPPR